MQNEGRQPVNPNVMFPQAPIWGYVFCKWKLLHIKSHIILGHHFLLLSSIIFDSTLLIVDDDNLLMTCPYHLKGLNVIPSISIFHPWAFLDNQHLNPYIMACPMTTL